MSIRQIIYLCLCLSSPLFANWHDRKAEGWAWYEDPKIERPDEQIEEEPKTKTAKETLEEAKKELEESLSLALLEPTHENIENYLIVQKKWHDQASLFSKEWQKVILSNPFLDHTASHPTSQYGLQFHKKALAQEKKQLIEELSSHYGLIFFYEGAKKESKVFSNVVKMFVRKHGWQVMAVSVDGKKLGGFENDKVDNGIVHALDIKKYPSLYVLIPDTNDLIPVSFGLRSLDVIENNIYLQFSNLEKGEV